MPTYNPHMMFVSMPGLRRRDLPHMPRLDALAKRGSARDLVPSFPCVTSSVQANMLTGRGPASHGIIGNGFYHRDRGEVEMWVGRNGLIEGPQLWADLKQRGITSAAWMTQNIRDAAADFIVTPEPIHHPDGRVDLWCYSKPDGLYQRLLNDMGHFPLMNYWGPMVNIKSTEWIINGALWLVQRERPRFNYVYVPHLDYAAQRFGPNSAQHVAACAEADVQLGRLFDGMNALGVEADYLIVSEYALTDVARVIYPNRVLRDAGMAIIEERDGREFLNLPKCAAFAVVDHQFAHVYVKDRSDIDAACGLFEGMPGIADALMGDAREKLGVKHPRSGEVVLVCKPDTWLAYYWWHDDAKAPPFARTVDIHAKPGYDPVELFIDMTTKCIPLNAGLVKGSHGAPALTPDQYGICITNQRLSVEESAKIKDTDVRGLIDAILS